jgi:hypothetical protein
MWSGTDRKAFYIDNKELVEEIAQEWIRKKLFGSQQFFNLKNLAEKNDVVTCSKTNNFVLYNKEGGWYNCHYFTPDSQLSKEFFRSMDKVVGFATYSLENIIFLQNLCTLFGVKIFHSFYRNHVYNDIAQNKNHLNLKYLYSMLKHDNIISTTGIYEYLKSDQKINKPSLQLFHDIVINLYSPEKNKEYFEEDNMHPNQKGHQKWVDEVLFPALQTKGIF